MARKFFYICAGMFLLVASWAIVAHVAFAQPPISRVAAQNYGGVVVTTDGYIYGWNGSSYTRNENVFSVTGHPQIPGDNVVAYGQSTVITASGEEFLLTGGTWSYRGNVFGSAPVQTQHESWGHVKARYQKTPGADNK